MAEQHADQTGAEEAREQAAEEARPVEKAAGRRRRGRTLASVLPGWPGWVMLRSTGRAPAPSRSAAARRRSACRGCRSCHGAARASASPTANNERSRPWRKGKQRTKGETHGFLPGDRGLAYILVIPDGDFKRCRMVSQTAAGRPRGRFAAKSCPPALVCRRRRLLSAQTRRFETGTMTAVADAMPNSVVLAVLARLGHRQRTLDRSSPSGSTRNRSAATAAGAARASR